MPRIETSQLNISTKTEYKNTSLSPVILFIMMLTAQGCSDQTTKPSPKPQPDESNKYELILSGECPQWGITNIDAGQLATYDQQLPPKLCEKNLCKCVGALVNRNIKPEEIVEYFTDTLWSFDDIIQLVDAGITAEQAKKYITITGRTLKSNIIPLLVKAGVTPEQAKEYLDITDQTDADDAEVRVNSFLALALHKIPPEQIRKYTNRFRGKDIADFIRSNISPEQALAYPEKLRGSTIKLLIEAGINSERAKNYPPYLGDFDIYLLVSKNITPEIVNKYPPYMAPEIIRLIEEGVSPEEAKKQYDREQNE